MLCLYIHSASTPLDHSGQPAEKLSFLLDPKFTTCTLKPKWLLHHLKQGTTQLPTHAGLLGVADYVISKACSDYT